MAVILGGVIILGLPILLLALMVALEISVRKSDRERGISDFW